MDADPTLPTEAAAPDQPMKTGRRARSPWLRAFQLAALGLVVGLLALLGWRVVASSRGTDLVSGISHGKQPAAPSFRLPVIWRHAETWPRSARQALVDGLVGPRELRGYPVVINF